MQITLNHLEIEQAITEYVGNQGISIEGKTTKVTMVAGRGGNGYTANVDIISDTVASPVRPVQEEPKPAAEIEFNDDDSENEVTDPEESTENLFAS